MTRQAERLGDNLEHLVGDGEVTIEIILDIILERFFEEVRNKTTSK